MLKVRYKGKITHTIDKGHKDFQYVNDWTKDKTFTYEDIYTFTQDYSMEDIKAYIEHDLKLVASGGYSIGHIHNVEIEITQV